MLKNRSGFRDGAYRFDVVGLGDPIYRLRSGHPCEVDMTVDQARQKEEPGKLKLLNVFSQPDRLSLPCFSNPAVFHDNRAVFQRMATASVDERGAEQCKFIV
jgi:hypothetical protein